MTTDSAVAQKLRAEVYGDPAGTIAILTTWIDRLRKDRRTTGKIGLIGSSMGADWAMQAAIADPVEATVIYYGRCPETEDLARLTAPVLGHFAELDDERSVTPPNVRRFSEAMSKAGASFEVR